jgi:predicted Zn finger-like uncharacterized protein
MDIVCENCKARFKVPDEKIPAGKVVSMPCPKCREKITVGGPKKTEPSAPPAVAKDQSVHDEVQAEAYDASEKPFDFAEEEGKTALVCESDPAVKKAIAAALGNLDYHITDAADTRDALKNMRYHVYDVILVNDIFDGQGSEENPVLSYLENLNMAIRRNIFVGLLSKTIRTMDNMAAFSNSVNMTINVKDMANMEQVLNRGITDNDFFVRVVREGLKKVGRG